MGSWSQAFLAKTMETRDRNCNRSEHHALFCEERKDWYERCQAFLEWVGSQILSFESIDYFGTSEYFSDNFDGEAINWSGVVNFYCMQMSLMVSIQFISAVIEMMHHHVFGLWQSCDFSWIDFRVFIHAFSIIIVKFDVKSKYPEEYSIVNKVGSGKTFSEEILFCVKLIASSFLI